MKQTSKKAAHVFTVEMQRIMGVWYTTKHVEKMCIYLKPCRYQACAILCMFVVHSKTLCNINIHLKKTIRNGLKCIYH